MFQYNTICKKYIDLFNVNAEKAFDHLELAIRFKTLEAFNFPDEIMHFYKNDEIALEWGTRQGCPLSPLLFALAIEPLAERIRQDPNVTGISIGKH